MRKVFYKGVKNDLTSGWASMYEENGKYEAELWTHSGGSYYGDDGFTRFRARFDNYDAANHALEDSMRQWQVWYS